MSILEIVKSFVVPFVFAFYSSIDMEVTGGMQIVQIQTVDTWLNGERPEEKISYIENL